MQGDFPCRGRIIMQGTVHETFNARPVIAITGDGYTGSFFKLCIISYLEISPFYEHRRMIFWMINIRMARLFVRYLKITRVVCLYLSAVIGRVNHTSLFLNIVYIKEKRYHRIGVINKFYLP